MAGLKIGTMSLQRLYERVCNTENYNTDGRVDANYDHDNWVENDEFVEATLSVVLTQTKWAILTEMTLMTVNLQRKLVLTTKICSIH